MSQPGDAAAPAPRGVGYWLRRALTLAFFAGLLALLTERVRAVEWSNVVDSLIAYDAGTVAGAGFLAAASYAIYCSFDFFGRRMTGHQAPPSAVASTAFVSYAFNLNLGALVGGIGFRYRLYSRYGLSPGTITRVLGLSIVTNWLGYASLLGLVFVGGVVKIPDDYLAGEQALRALGVLLLLVAPAYCLACAFSPKRLWHVRGQRIDLPSAPMALAQLSLSLLNWLCIAAIVWVLLQSRVDYPSVLGALLLAAVAGVITHVPAGLGVIEAVFLALLGDRLGEPVLLAARAIYYLLPGVLALVVYLGLEARARRPPMTLARVRG